MPLSILSKLLATLLVPAITALVLALVMNQTVFSSHYLEGKLAATNSYERLSVALTDEISKQAPGVMNEQVSATLKPILAPDVLKTKINSALDQTEVYYRGNGPRPVIDLSDLTMQVQAAGIPIPAGSVLAAPQVPVQASEETKKYNKTFSDMQKYAIVVVTVLVTALLVVSWCRRQWVALPSVLIVVGILLGVWALGTVALSDMMVRYIKSDTTSSAFLLLGRDVVSVIGTDIARRIGTIAVVFGMTGIGTRMLAGRIDKNKDNAPTAPVGRRPAPTAIN